ESDSRGGGSRGVADLRAAIGRAHYRYGGAQAERHLSRGRRRAHIVVRIREADLRIRGRAAQAGSDRRAGIPDACAEAEVFGAFERQDGARRAGRDAAVARGAPGLLRAPEPRQRGVNFEELEQLFLALDLHADLEPVERQRREQLRGGLAEIHGVLLRSDQYLGAARTRLLGDVAQLARTVAMMVGEFDRVGKLDAERRERTAESAWIAQAAEHTGALGGRGRVGFRAVN